MTRRGVNKVSARAIAYQRERRCSRTPTLCAFACADGCTARVGDCVDARRTRAHLGLAHELVALVLLHVERLPDRVEEGALAVADEARLERPRQVSARKHTDTRTHTDTQTHRHTDTQVADVHLLTEGACEEPSKLREIEGARERTQAKAARQPRREEGTDIWPVYWAHDRRQWHVQPSAREGKL
eukprot:3814630-Pleurochrysis_carterae.AAC.2